jgi:pimeloyl-ACP methyl ester carboxylesterase
MTDIRLGSMVIEDTGEGPPVIMIHGLGGNSNSFETLMHALQGYRVLRPDLPGAGRSALRPGMPGIDGLVSCVRDCLRAAGIARAHVVGHSMGTLIGQHLAARSPGGVASLTLFGPVLAPPPAAAKALAERAAEARAKGMAGIASSVSSGSVAARSRAENPLTAAFVRESLMGQDPRGYAAHCEALSTALAADHSAIRCPTLLVAGAADRVAPPDMARDLHARIAGSRLEIVPGIAHWMMVEAAQRSAQLLRAHLDETAV